MTDNLPAREEWLSDRLIGALVAIRACPGRYHTSVTNQVRLAYEAGFTDGWTIQFRRDDRNFTFSHQFVNMQADDDEIWWGCAQDVCDCLIRRNFLGTHRLILPPAELDLDRAEIYTRLRLDGMTQQESLDIALLL